MIQFFFSDKIALKASGAKPVTEEEAPRLYQMVRELTTRAGLPMPTLHIIPQAQPNAFATGRSPKKSAVAVTQGLLSNLSEDEVRGVLAHELAHIRNRDMLTTTIASSIGMAITYIAYMFMWFGDDESPLGLVASLGMVILAPISATLIQLAVSQAARVLGRRHRRRDLGQPGVARERAAEAAGGRGGHADAGEPGGRAALHRQAVLGRRLREAVLDPPADRGARPPAAPDAARRSR